MKHQLRSSLNNTHISRAADGTNSADQTRWDELLLFWTSLTSSTHEEKRGERVLLSLFVTSRVKALRLMLRSADGIWWRVTDC